ncbi:MAG: hypothetical protein GX903_09495, partial [Spirochaetales bacterium]|nr:hypothetical protein [Spirochaetales bacterium]
MKYHATISTIVISIIVVLIFFFVASFTVFSLQILSPGYMISDYVLKQIPSLEPYSIKYSYLDSSLKDGIYINEVEIKFNDITIVQTDKIKISSSLYSLLKGYFTKQITLDIDFFNLNINLPFDYKELVLPNLLASNKKEAAATEKEPIKFDFSFKSDTTNITYMDLISLNSLSFFVDLNPDFSLQNVKLQLDSFNGIYDDYNLALTDFRFQLEQKEKIYIDMSVEKAQLGNLFNLKVDALRLNSSLKSLKDIDIFTLPIDLSLENLNYDSEALKVSSLGINLSYKNKQIFALFNSLNTSYGDFAVNLKSLPLYLTLSENSLKLD